MQNLFQKATKLKARLRLALSGPSGSGKTYTALTIAKHLGAKTAVLDTEHGSASKYADIFDFDVIDMPPPYHPEEYGKYITMAGEAGYDVLIIDSLSHAWNGKGGVLQIVDDETAKRKTNNSMVGWKVATPIHQQLIENILGAKLHIIATMRSKQEYLVEKDDKGKTQISKVGLAPIQRDGMEYEFDVWGEMDLENRMSVSKTRCPQLTGKIIPKPGESVAATLRGWLEGAEPLQREDAQVNPLAVVYNDKERVRFHAIGSGVYGGDWDAKRVELIQHATGNRTDSMKELNREEFERIMKGLEKKQHEVEALKQHESEPQEAEPATAPQTPGEQSEALYNTAEAVA